MEAYFNLLDNNSIGLIVLWYASCYLRILIWVNIYKKRKEVKEGTKNLMLSHYLFNVFLFVNILMLILIWEIK